jgi:hypothetical protein
LTGKAAQSPFPGAGNGSRTLGFRVSLRNDLPAGFASGCVKPEAPEGLVVAGGLDESYPCQVLISWDPVTKDVAGNSLEKTGCTVTGYRVYYDSVPEVFGYFADVAPEDATGFTLDVSGILSSKIYVSVAAENSGGLGKKSPEVVVNDTTSPEKAEGISAAAAGANAITVSWDENDECDLAGYYLYRKKSTETPELTTGLIPAGSGEYTDAGLDAGVSYTYTIEAVDYGFNAGEMSDAVTVAVP